MTHLGLVGLVLVPAREAARVRALAHEHVEQLREERGREARVALRRRHVLQVEPAVEPAVEQRQLLPSG